MTQEQFERLKQFEDRFYVAIHGNYYRAMVSQEVNIIAEACKELNIYIRVNCPACMLSALQALGRAYYEKKSEIEQEAAKLKDDKTIKEEVKQTQKAHKETQKKKSK